MDIYQNLKTKSQSDRHLVRYVMFIKSRQPSNGTVERHHICPKANDLFPQYSNLHNHPWNAIDLTPREHYVAHLLLWKIFGGSQTKALWLMTLKNKRVGSRAYEENRRIYIAAVSNKPLQESTKAKISSALKGKPLSEETRKKMSLAKMGNKNTLGKKWTQRMCRE